MANDANLNARQRQILDYVKNKIKTSGYPPSVREIGQAVGLKSSSTVHAYLLQLEDKGLLRRDPAKPRAIILTETDHDIRDGGASYPRDLRHGRRALSLRPRPPAAISRNTRQHHGA